MINNSTTYDHYLMIIPLKSVETKYFSKNLDEQNIVIHLSNDPFFIRIYPSNMYREPNYIITVALDLVFSQNVFECIFTPTIIGYFSLDELYNFLNDIKHKILFFRFRSSSMKAYYIYSKYITNRKYNYLPLPYMNILNNYANSCMFEKIAEEFFSFKLHGISEKCFIKFRLKKDQNSIKLDLRFPHKVNMRLKLFKILNQNVANCNELCFNISLLVRLYSNVLRSKDIELINLFSNNVFIKNIDDIINSCYSYLRNNKNICPPIMIVKKDKSGILKQCNYSIILKIAKLLSKHIKELSSWQK